MSQLYKRLDVRISVIYGVVATLWIIFSDAIVLWLFGTNHHLESLINMFKGLGFVIVTGLALFIVLSRELRKRSQIEQELQLERDISPVAIVVYDAKGLITYANMQAEKILGRPRREIVGQHYDSAIWKVTNPDGQSVAGDYPEFSKILASHQTIFGIQQAVEVRGKRVLLDINLAPIFKPEGALSGGIATFTDVTNAKTQENILRENEERFRLLFNNNPLPMWVIDRETLAFVEVNESAVVHYGYEHGEFLRMTLRDINPREDVPRLMDAVQKPRATLQKLGEWRHILKNGQIIDVDIVTHTIEYAHRPAVLVVGQDISQRKQSEQALRESEASLKHAQSIAHMGDWSWDLTTSKVHVSDEIYRIFGIDDANFNNQLNEFIQLIHPDDNAAVLQVIDALINSKTAIATEFRTVWPDGSVHDLWVESDEITVDAQGNALRVTGILQDVSAYKAAQKALIESENRYRMLIEQASDAIFITGVDGKYADANSAACKLLGYTREELLQKQLFDIFIIEPDKPLRYEALMQGQTLLRERQMIRKDGSLVSVEVSSKLLLDGTVQAIARDITERKKAEEELRLKSSALEAAANGIAITDIDGVIQWVNPSFAALTGYDTNEAEGHNPRELVRSGQHNQTFYKEMWDTILQGKVWRGELVNRRKNSTLYTEEMTITPVRNEAGKISHFIAIKQDITERKLTEAASHRLNTELEQRVTERTMQLNHIKNRIESILNSTADAIIYIGVDGTIQQVNPAFTETFGYQPEEIWQSSLFKLVVEEGRSTLERTFADILADRQPRHVDVTASCRDGKNFDAAVLLSPVIENSEHLVGVVASIHDITSRNNMLHHAISLSELKSRYVSMAAHDLRNPMAIILSASETLEHYYDRLDADRKQAKYEQIRDSIKIMTNILDDILTMGQVESGKLIFRPAPLDIKSFCQNMIIEMVQATASTIHIDFSADNVGSSVTMDSKLLRHILGNLLSNAIKYSSSSNSILFNIRKEADQIVFCIQDYGIGIPKADQERLFETFHRASNARNIPGTGLGLAIVKQSVDLHCGTITFESEEGHGTTFTVKLPAVS